MTTRSYWEVADMIKKDLSLFNEADVREEIISPLLFRLHYHTGTENNIIREQPLRYEKSYLGHKNPDKDWPLRGKADYICEVDRTIRWTIEAKSPAREIGTEEIEQAYTYARHPEVRALYFCLCNGRELRIFQTEDAPGTAPILCIKLDDLENNWYAIENLLSPASIHKNHPRTKLDFGQPIGQGLRSIVRVISGKVVIQKSVPQIPIFRGYTLFVVNGVVQRQTDKGLLAILDTLSPYESIQKLNEQFGLTRFEIISNDSELSTDANIPTVFQSDHRIRVSHVEAIPGFSKGSNIQLPTYLTCDVKTFARGVLKGNIFAGNFKGSYFYHETRASIAIDGYFDITIA